jgi:hypothetical protein
MTQLIYLVPLEVFNALANSNDAYSPCMSLLITPRPGTLFILSNPGNFRASASVLTSCPDFLILC